MSHTINMASHSNKLSSQVVRIQIQALVFMLALTNHIMPLLPYSITSLKITMVTRKMQSM